MKKIVIEWGKKIKEVGDKELKNIRERMKEVRNERRRQS